MHVSREPIACITDWLAREVGDAPDSPNTIPWRIAKISEEIGEAYEAFLADGKDALRHELRDIIATTEVAAFSIDPTSLPRNVQHPYEMERVGWSYLANISVASGRASAALFGLVGRNPRKGITHTPQQALQALHDLSEAAATMLAALEHSRGGPQRGFDAHLEHLTRRATAQASKGSR